MDYPGICPRPSELCGVFLCTWHLGSHMYQSMMELSTVGCRDFLSGQFAIEDIIRILVKLVWAKEFTPRKQFN